MALNFDSQSLAQSIRMRRKRLPESTIIVVVEGTSDQTALVSFFREDVYLVAARGREKLLAAYRQLENEHLRNCIYLIDCDGADNTDLLGRTNLVVSDFRDIEADLLCVMQSFQRVASAYLGASAARVAEVRARIRDLELFASVITARIGVLLDKAREARARTRVVDTITNTKRPVALRDLPSYQLWIDKLASPDFASIALEMQPLLGWDNELRVRLVQEAVAGGSKACRLHSRAQCVHCMTRRFSNGHNLVSLTASILEHELEDPPSARHLAAAIRAGSDTRLMNQWSTISRLRKWESQHSTRLLASP